MKRKTAASALLMLTILAGCGDGTGSQAPAQSPPEVDELPLELGNAVLSDGSTPEGACVKYYSFDNSSYVEYPSEADFLAAFGFEGTVPFYEYCLEQTDISEEGEEVPRTEWTRLYYSEELKTGCVVEDSIYEGTSHKLGSVIDRVEQAGEDAQEQWGSWKLDPYSIPGLEEVKDSSEIEDYQEHSEYDDAGRLISFRADGIFESPWTNEDGRSPVASLTLLYGEGGKLLEREVFRNDDLFGSTHMLQHSYYDELERVCYETCYVTHGEEKYFYFYPDDDPTPAYGLYIDHGGNGVILAKY